MRKEIFEVPVFAQENIEKVWGGRMRVNELETVKDLYNLAKEMGLIRLKSKSNRRIVEVSP